LGGSLEKYRIEIYTLPGIMERHIIVCLLVLIFFITLSLKKRIIESNTTKISPNDVSIQISQHTFEHFNPHSAFLPWFGRVYNSIFIPFSVSFIAAFYVLFPTHERVSKVFLSLNLIKF